HLRGRRERGGRPPVRDPHRPGHRARPRAVLRLRRRRGPAAGQQARRRSPHGGHRRRLRPGVDRRGRARRDRAGRRQGRRGRNRGRSPAAGRPGHPLHPARGQLVRQGRGPRRGHRRRRGRLRPAHPGTAGMRRALPVLAVLAALLTAIALVNPHFLEPAGFLAFLKRAAPLVILAAGQYFVIVSGEFDLSVGSLVPAEVVIAARLIDGDESATWPVLALLIAAGLLVGLVNGVVTTKMRVPSFIVTLGMLLVLSGAVFLWTGGAPRGALSEGFRVFGRGGLGPVPWSVLILVVLGAAAIRLMRADFGKTLMAAGDNERAAALSGVR